MERRTIRGAGEKADGCRWPGAGWRAARNRIPQICRALKCSPEEIKEAFEAIAKLDLYSGSTCTTHIAQAIHPDVILRQEGDFAATL